MAIVRSFAMQSAKGDVKNSRGKFVCATVFALAENPFSLHNCSQASLAVDGCIGSHGVAETADWNKSNGLLFAPFHPGQSKSKQTS
ncbi:Enoyl-[acyl-carrier-protein] reductase [Trichinella pseudospiralis]|uniref:Uncharacterized protein n=1 Tax=Trichinella pseudospiralis TaxID=6337 RepID=A0A0V0XNE5_TRIPS|nr:hypothetical protein T4E_6016 [Trichinella pseudospiralis]